MAEDPSTASEPRDQELAALRQQVADLQQQLAAAQPRADWARALISQFPVGRILVYDTDLRYLEVDGAASARGAATRDALVGRTIWEALLPEVAAVIEEPYRAALAGQTISLQMPFADGTYEVFILPIRDDTGVIRAGMVISIDITARIIAERQLQIFQQLVEQAPYGILLSNTQRMITYANPALRALFGYGDELIDMPVSTLLTSMAFQDLPLISQRLSSGQAWSGTHVYQRADGTTFPGAVTLFPIAERTGAAVGTGSIVRDVTAEEQAQQERDAQVRAAQEAAIRELATPLIPLDEHIVVMPLVGTLDSQRIQQVMEVLLEGIVAHEADIAILDITGVTMVDTQVAQGILRATQAAKLLGTQVLLTGLGANIALTLTTLGAELSGVITLSTLQQGIAYALQQRASNATHFM